MLPEKRRQEILRLNREQQGISIKDLANYFKISNMTILRDIKVLEEKSLLEVVRGGVIPIKKDDQGAIAQGLEIYDSKKRQSLSEKLQIAAYCASLVKEGSVIVLEAGSTATAIIGFLSGKKKLTVISNGFLAIKEASNKLDVTSRVLCTGGLLDKTYPTFVGPDVDVFFSNKQTDIAFISCVAFDSVLGPMDSNPLDIQAKKSIVASAQRKVLMVDKNKFNSKSVMQTIDMSQITDIVTNASVDSDVMDSLSVFRDQGIIIHLV